MPPKYHFLLIGYRPEEQWPGFLQTAVHSLGKLHTAQSEDEATKMLSQHRYDLAIVDAGGVDDAALLVSRLQKQQVRPPILVVTASPTWQSARAVLKAGAVDYVGRSFDKDELRSRIEEILKLTPSKSNSLGNEIRIPMTTILFADNTSAFLNIRSEFLVSEGYRVIPAINPAEARKLLEQGGIDLAILDIRLQDDDDDKDVSGLTLAKETAPSIPKIILTGYSTVDAVREALRPQLDGLPAATEFVDKYEGTDALILAIHRALGTDASFGVELKQKPGEDK